MTVATFQQVTFRIRDDDGDETGATWLANQGDDYSMPVDTNFRVRFRVDETTGTKDWADNTFNLYYSHNSGEYAAVGFLTTPVQYAVTGTGNYADGDDCTEQLTGGTGTFVTDNNGMSSGDASVTNSGSAGNLFECEFCLIIDSGQVSNGDSIELRVYNGASAFGSGYTDWPNITVVEIETLSVNKAESVTAADTPTADVSDPQVSASDGVTVGDDPTAMLVMDTLTTSVSDGVTAADVPAADVSDPQAAVSESITAADNPSADVSDPQVSASDTVTAADSPSASVGTPQVSASDAVTVGDTPALSVGAAGDLTISVADGVTVAESVVLAFEAIAISVQDGISLAEAVSIATANLAASASDTVTAADSPTASLPSTALSVSSSEAVSVSDSASGVTQLFSVTTLTWTSKQSVSVQTEDSRSFEL